MRVKTRISVVIVLLLMCLALARVPFGTHGTTAPAIQSVGQTSESGSSLSDQAQNTPRPVATAANTAVEPPDGFVCNYTAENFTEVPSDWELYDGCEKTKTTTTFSDGDMVVQNTGSGAAANYYGSLYRIATDRVYSDFMFELRFKINSYVDTGRFFSVMFHTADNSDGKLIGYFVNYRVNGGSAVSCYDGETAHDTGSVNKNITLSDNGYHTFTIVLQDKTAVTYMDGTQLTSWVISNKDTYLGGPIDNGGFALMINRSAMAISSVKIYRSQNYSMSNFKNRPADWVPFTKSYVNDSTTYCKDGELIITDASAAAPGKYYGSVYRIAPDMSFGNFTFEMTFRIISYVDTARFFSVMFHNKLLQDGNMESYYVNYRVDGRSAPCAYAGGSGADGTVVNKGIRLDDGKTHTLRITLIGTEVTDHIDGIKITAWDLSDRSGKIQDTIEEGGFSLMVNKMSIAVSSVNITSVPRDDYFTNAYYAMNSGLINAPTVVCDVKNEDILDRAITAAERPSNVILRYKDGDIVDETGAAISDFYSVYKRIAGRIIPVVRVEDEASADTFIEFMTQKYRIADLSVASSKPAVLKKLRTALPWTRGMIIYSDIDEPKAVVAQLNVDLATVAILPQRVATLENVTYIQARFKTVWAVTDSYAFADIYGCIVSGACGIVSEHFADVYEALSSYDAKSQPRTSMNVAHRGCSNLSYENSLSAVRIAIENGATHLELDGKLTTDNQIVIIHDDAVKNTTTYDGNKKAEQMTLAEAQSYDLQLRGTPKTYLQDDNGNNIIEHLPSLRQVLDLIKDTDVILVFEIKTDTTAIVPVLKSIVEEYDMLDRLICITFNDSGDMISTMYDNMPTTPVARLEGLGSVVWSMDDIDYMIQYLNANNVALDKAYYTGGANSLFNRYLNDRGMVGWYWTFANGDAVDVGEELGYLGLTNNCAEYFADRARVVTGTSEQTKSSLAKGDTVKVDVTTYAGITTDEDGEVFYCTATANGWTVVARYLTERGYLYTCPFEIAKA